MKNDMQRVPKFNFWFRPSDVRYITVGVRYEWTGKWWAKKERPYGVVLSVSGRGFSEEFCYALSEKEKIVRWVEKTFQSGAVKKKKKRYSKD